MNTRRHIIVTKQWPIPTGGGLGVARQFFLGLAEVDLENHDVWAICGPDVIEVKDAATCRHLADGESKRPRKNRLVATLRQIQAIRRLSSSGTSVIAFTPFYAWPVLRLLCPKFRLIHVEQSKGGRHQELAAMRGRFGWKETLVQFAVAWNFVFPHEVIFPSNGAIDLFCQKNERLASLVRRKARVIHNGIEPVPSKIAQAASGKVPFKILSVCEDVPEKNLLDSLRAVEILCDQGRKVDFHHFGSVRDETRRIAEEQQLPAVFHGPKPRSHIVAALQQSDLFLHLPRVAVFDLVLIEAMSAGIPIVASPVGGNLEALGEDYLHFANSPASASAEILAISEFPESATRIGQALRTRANKSFTAVAMADQYLEI